jgi:hypothetical protein
MNARYIVPTIVTAIIIGLAVSAAFAIGPAPFIEGTFNGYPPNNESHDYSRSSPDLTLEETYAYFRLEGDIVCSTYDVTTAIDTTWVDGNYLQDFLSLHMQNSFLSNSVDANRLSPSPNNPISENDKWGEPFRESLTGTEQYPNGTNLAERTYFYLTRCPEGGEILAQTKLSLPAHCINLASTTVDLTLAKTNTATPLPSFLF